jgi:hypothetical protein
LCLCTLKEGGGIRLKTQLYWFVFIANCDYMFRPCSAIFRSQCLTQRRKNTQLFVHRRYMIINEVSLL